MSLEEILNIILAILLALSELLPFLENIQGNGVLHSILAKKSRGSEEKHLSKDESAE